MDTDANKGLAVLEDLKKNCKKTSLIISIILGVLFSVFYLPILYFLSAMSNTTGYSNAPFYIMMLIGILILAGLFFLVKFILYKVIFMIKRKRLEGESNL